MPNSRSAQSSRAIYERLLRGEAESSEYAAALRREARDGRVELKGWPARWAGVVVRARKAEAERDRYAMALEGIAQQSSDPKARRAARLALDQTQARAED